MKLIKEYKEIFLQIDFYSVDLIKESFKKKMS